MTQPSDKILLRRQLRQQRRALTDRQRRDEEAATVGRLLELRTERAAMSLGSYMALGGELDLEQLHAGIWSAGQAVWLPRVVGDPEAGRMVWSAVRSADELAVGALGIAEPDPALPCKDLPPIELLLVPGLAFTVSGQRLGQGGGFYDRLLHRLPSTCLTVGIGFALQRRDSLPTEFHDQPLQALCLSGKLISCGD